MRDAVTNRRGRSMIRGIAGDAVLRERMSSAAPLDPSLLAALDGFRRGDRIVQLVRLAGAAVFFLVVLINGPLLGVDPPAFWVRALGLATLIGGSAAVFLQFNRGRPPRWVPWLSVVVDVVAITALGLMAGGARTHLATALLLVVAMNGLRLEKRPLVFAVVVSTLGYLAMVHFGSEPERVDRQIVYVAVMWIMGMVAAGTVELSRHLALVALARQRERIELEQALGGYFSPQVKAALLTNPAQLQSARREITALFADLSGFTRLAETAPEAIVMETLECYIGALADVALANDGTVDNFLGDAVLVVFNTPTDQTDHAARAVACARQMQERMLDLHRARAAEGRPTLGLVVAVNSGLATAGHIQGGGRRHFTVIGDAVNVAARLEALGAPGEIVIGTTTARLAGLPAEPFESRAVPGRAAPVRFVRERTPAAALLQLTTPPV